jgi:Flp pilus assembly protein TadD
MQYALEADRLAQGPDSAGALAAYDKAVKAGYANAGVHRNRGVMLMRLSRNAEAADALRLAITMEPKNAELYRYLGIMLYNSGDRPHGAEAIRKSAELDPKNVETQSLLKQLGPPPHP